jgi:hypothetical protein
MSRFARTRLPCPIFTPSALLLLLLMLGLVSARCALAERVNITVDVVDGGNGHAMPNERVLLFVGASQGVVAQHSKHQEGKTDANGSFVLNLDSLEVQWMQAFVDMRTQCQVHPNDSFLSVARIISDGVVAPNVCGKLLNKAMPGHLVIFARPATLTEKMHW